MECQSGSKNTSARHASSPSIEMAISAFFSRAVKVDGGTLRSMLGVVATMPAHHADLSGFPSGHKGLLDRFDTKVRL
ncbi:hypothetical protein BJF93_20055 [Xaviernesmea oryzae]|uniref:Uncharacterized protein n=1 Tax=Xaviernesmea oryzae TaxID=464029 RepID=A0A1Q9B3Y4_9HYPH|nr:hypothetical protein BJF93_20055 [Xaviernesmea oryzae]